MPASTKTAHCKSLPPSALNDAIEGTQIIGEPGNRDSDLSSTLVSSEPSVLDDTQRVLGTADDLNALVKPLDKPIYRFSA